MEQRYQKFTGMILNISRCIQKIKNVEMAALGLKGKQVQCLFLLDQFKDGLSLTKLCELCDEDKGAMSRTIKELTTKNLVQVVEQATQKYRNPIKLTTSGQTTAKIIVTKIDKILKIVSAEITVAERDAFYRTLTQISDNLTEVCQNYGGEK